MTHGHIVTSHGFCPLCHRSGQPLQTITDEEGEQVCCADERGCYQAWRKWAGLE